MVIRGTLDPAEKLLCDLGWNQVLGRDHIHVFVLIDDLERGPSPKQLMELHELKDFEDVFKFE